MKNSIKILSAALLLACVSPTYAMQDDTETMKVLHGLKLSMSSGNKALANTYVRGVTLNEPAQRALAKLSGKVTAVDVGQALYDSLSESNKKIIQSKAEEIPSFSGTKIEDLSRKKTKLGSSLTSSSTLGGSIDVKSLTEKELQGNTLYMKLHKNFAQVKGLLADLNPKFEAMELTNAKNIKDLAARDKTIQELQDKIASTYVKYDTGRWFDEAKYKEVEDKYSESETQKLRFKKALKQGDLFDMERGDAIDLYKSKIFGKGKADVALALKAITEAGIDDDNAGHILVLGGETADSTKNIKKLSKVMAGDDKVDIQAWINLRAEFLALNDPDTVSKQIEAVNKSEGKEEIAPLVPYNHEDLVRAAKELAVYAESKGVQHISQLKFSTPLQDLEQEFIDSMLGYEKPDPADDDTVAKGAWNSAKNKNIAFVDKYAPFVNGVHFSGVSGTIGEDAYVLEFKPQLIAAMAEFDADSPETLKTAVIEDTIRKLSPTEVTHALTALKATVIDLSASKDPAQDDENNRVVLINHLATAGNLKLTA